MFIGAARYPSSLHMLSDLLRSHNPSFLCYAMLCVQPISTLIQRSTPSPSSWTFPVAWRHTERGKLDVKQTVARFYHALTL